MDSVLAHLAAAWSSDPASAGVSGMLACVRGQAHNLRPPQPVSQPGYVLRQLCIQACELADKQLADEARAKLRELADTGLLPVWTTRKASGTLLAEIAGGCGVVWAVAVLLDGRVAYGGYDGRVRLWDPAVPGAPPAEVGRHGGPVGALAVLPDGRVVSGGDDVRAWDVRAQAEFARVACTAVALTVSPGHATDDCRLVIAHQGGGISEWLIRAPA